MYDNDSIYQHLKNLPIDFESYNSDSEDSILSISDALECEMHNNNLLVLLIEQEGPNILYLIRERHQIGNNILHICCKNFSISHKALAYLMTYHIDQCRVLASMPNEYNLSPYHLACKCDSLNAQLSYTQRSVKKFKMILTKLALLSGIEQKTFEENYQLPLHIAIQNDMWCTAGILIMIGHSIDAVNFENNIAEDLIVDMDPEDHLANFFPSIRMILHAALDKDLVELQRLRMENDDCFYFSKSVALTTVMKTPHEYTEVISYLCKHNARTFEQLYEDLDIFKEIEYLDNSVWTRDSYDNESRVSDFSQDET